MVRLHRQPICVASALIVPLLTLANPAWLGVMGVGPAWSVLCFCPGPWWMDRYRVGSQVLPLVLCSMV